MGLGMDIALHCGTCRGYVRLLGGELVSYQDGQGTEYIWQGDPDSWTGQNPLLFPIVGKLKDGIIRAHDQVCTMSQHGVARNHPFTVVEQGEDFVVLAQRENPQTLAAFPFPYGLQVRHQLTQTGFSFQVTVTNTGDGDLSFCLGGHTAFRCPLHPGDAFEDYALVFDQQVSVLPRVPSQDGLSVRGNTVDCMAPNGKTIPLDYGIFDHINTLIFENPTATGVSLRHKETGRGVHMDFTGFPLVAFWTPPHKSAPFICLEPWQGCSDFVDSDGTFVTKPYAITLAPKESWCIGYEVTTL